MPATTKQAPSNAPVEPVITVSDAGPCRKKVSIQIPAAAVASELAGAFDVITQQAALPGFRPGKAPRRLVERMFGKTAREDAKKRLVSTAYQKALESHQLRVLGDPEGGKELEDLDVSPEKDIAFTLEVEVAPEFALPAVDAIAVKKPVYAVTDGMVQEEVDRLAVHEGELVSQEAAQPGDYCTGVGRIRLGEENVLELDGAVIQVPPKDKGGKGAILGVMVEDFGSQIGLPKPGATLRVKAVGPEHHETVRIRGQKIDIEFQVARVDRIVPASMESLVQRTGAPTEQALRDALRQRLEQRNMVRQQVAMRRQIAERLLTETAMELPSRLTERQAARNLERKRMELLYRGFNPVQVEDHLAEMRSMSGDAAQRELKLFFIMDKVASDLNIAVGDGEVNQRIAQLAFERGERPERLRNELIQRGQIPWLVQQIREHKAMDALVAKAKVTEVPAEELEKQTA